MPSHALLFVTPMDCSPPGSSVHGISQARILEGLVLPDLGIEPSSPASPALAGRFFTRVPRGKPKILFTYNKMNPF